MALQPSSDTPLDRSSTTPFLLRLFWRPNRALEPHEFSIAPPSDAASGSSDYSSLLPTSIRQQSLHIYTWPTCTLSELTGLLTSVLPPDVLPSPAVGTRLVYKLIFPDTRAEVREGGRGKWIDKPLGSVVIGDGHGNGERDGADDDDDGDANAGAAGRSAGLAVQDLHGDADKTLGDARFVIGDYVACTIYPPGPDGRVAPLPPSSRGGGRDGYAGSFSRRGPLPPPASSSGLRDAGYANGGSGYGRGGGGGGYRGSGGFGGARGGRGEFGDAPPVGEWRRGERPQPGYGGGGYGRGGRGGRQY